MLEELVGIHCRQGNIDAKSTAEAAKDILHVFLGPHHKRILKINKTLRIAGVE